MTRRPNSELPEQILGEAEAIVVSSGYEAVNMRTIAKRAGVSATIIYHYFKSKDDLLYRLQLITAEKLNARIRHLENHPDPHEALHLLGKEYIAFAENNPELYRLLLSNMGGGSLTEENQPVIFYTYNIARQCLQRMAEMHETRVNPSYAAMMGWVMLHGFSSLLLAGNLELAEGLDREKLKRIFFDFYTSGPQTRKYETD
ncbi:MAG: TetR/AcrR family transcriptional regulator [Spirochaetales bacterium]|nr:TetR/AcrR family transcriptional regulator [Spirochaetales bacterium]